MRFVIDENAPLLIRTELNKLGHDVTRSVLGAKDHEVLSHAKAEDRILITFDSDFGDLIIRRGAPAPPGVIYLRLRRPLSPEEAAQLVVSLLASETAIKGNLTVIDRENIRQRPLPRGGR